MFKLIKKPKRAYDFFWEEKKLQYKNEFFPSKEISKKTGIEWRNLTNKEK